MRNQTRETRGILPATPGGKAAVLTLGLTAVTTEFVVTIDADTFLQRQDLRRIMARLITDPPHTAAVAGTVLAKELASVGDDSASRVGLLSGYCLSETAAVPLSGYARGAGDIVVTWALLKRGYRIGFEPTACAFTLVPWSWRGFSRQRQRWALGMIEGLKAHGDLIWKRPRLSGFFVALDLLFPLLDAAYSLVFLPGVILALLGSYWIAGPMTLFVIPMVLTVAMIMFSQQQKVLAELGLRDPP